METEAFEKFVGRAHAGQVDKLGKPYVGHLLRVRDYAAAIVASLPEGMMSGEEARDTLIAALGHDVIEDTDATEGSLLAMGTPPGAVTKIKALSKNDWTGTYQGYVEERICKGDLGTLVVKLADNQDNGDPERIAQLPPEKRKLSQRYEAARAVMRPELDRRIEEFLANRPAFA